MNSVWADYQVTACSLCGRNCGTDRTKGAGRCGGTDRVLAARAALHMWEEPCISGSGGSGTIFFAGCPLGCVFCQNREIALLHQGLPRGAEYLTAEELAGECLRLQGLHANNINLVTPTHYVPWIIEAVALAREAGLSIPIVYNTGSYENAKTIEALAGTVDVFLPDLKFMDPQISGRYAAAPDYFDVASAAIDGMVGISGGPAEFDGRGIMTKGVLVRHMILPGHTKDSMRILEYLFRRYGHDIWISIMNQYTPMPGIGERYPGLSRKLTRREYRKVVDYALDLGIQNAFIQEGGTADGSFVPEWGMHRR